MPMGEPFSVLYEDNHLLIVDKSPGILAQGDATGDEPLAELCKTYIKNKYNKPGAVFLGVVHRLDRPVSGIVVLARTSKALERMNKLFREKETHKIYYAIVSNKPSQESATLIHWLLKDEKKNKTTAYSRETNNALRSELSYSTVGRHGNNWLLKVEPITGRPHQIRVQLATIGCVIKGDVKYGDAVANSDSSIYLHAGELSFIHPVKKEMLNVTAPFRDYGLWKDFRKFIESTKK